MAVEQITTNSQVLSDLIKVGLPSVVALAGTLTSFILALRGHKKDLLIEELRRHNEQDKERYRRQGILVEESSVKLAKMQTAFTNYGVLLNVKADADARGEAFPESSVEELRARYHLLVESLHSGVELEAHISLLGNPAITETFHKYWHSLSAVPEELAPSRAKIDDIGRKTVSVTEKYRAVLAHLSKVFMHG